MYLRQNKRKNGRIYLTIEEGYREQGKKKTRHIETIGYVDELVKAGIKDPVSHWKKIIEERNMAAKEAAAPIITKFSSAKKIDKRDKKMRVELGAVVPSAYFHRDLKIWDFFENRRSNRKFNYDPCRILELLVWNRISSPSSKKVAWESKNSFPRKCNFSLDDVYRGLDYLNSHSNNLVKHMNQSLESARGPRNKKHLFYDVTNYYFEIEDEDGFRMRGVSKEHRPNPIVQMGLFLDTDGLPYDYEIFPGNTNDMITLLPALKKADVRNHSNNKKERTIIVADKGLNTSENIAACLLDGNGYIFSQSVRKATKELKSWVLDDEGYEWYEGQNYKIKSRLSEKIVYITGEDGRRHKVKVPVKEVAFWSRKYFERSRHERAKVIEKSVNALKRGDVSSALSRMSIKYAKDNPMVRKTGEKAQHNWSLNLEKIAAEEAMDGYYCIVTSEEEMPCQEIIDAYRDLWKIEESFRVLKGDFDARPVYVSREEHIRAHFLICYISLLIMRLMQLDTGQKYSARDISEAVRNIVGHKLDKNLYLFDYRTAITDELGEVLGINLAKQVLSKSQIREMLAQVKNPKI
ncbi:MAG: IS1634 family transposase [Enterococcus sp.]|nr:IS1634 family transposase [Enterococcus sp.]